MRKKSVVGTWIVLLGALFALLAFIWFAASRFSVEQGVLRATTSKTSSLGAQQSEAQRSGPQLTGPQLSGPDSAVDKQSSSATVEPDADSPEDNSPTSTNSVSASTENANPENTNPQNTNGGDKVVEANEPVVEISEPASRTPAEPAAEQTTESNPEPRPESTTVPASGPTSGQTGQTGAESVSADPAVEDVVQEPGATTETVQEELPDLRLLVEFTKQRIAVAGLLPQSESLDAFLDELQQLDTDRPVVNQIIQVPKAVGNTEWLPGLASVFSILDSDSNVELLIDVAQLSAVGTVGSEQESANFVERLRQATATLSQQDGFVEPRLDLQVSPLQEATLQLQLDPQRVVASGLLNAGQSSQLDLDLEAAQGVEIDWEVAERVKDLASLQLLVPLLQTLQDTLESASVLWSGTSIDLIGKAQEEPAQEIERRLRLLLQVPLAVSISIEEAEKIEPLTPEEKEKQDQISALQEAINNVSFEAGGTELSDETIEALDLAFETLFLYSDLRISLRVHASDTASSVDNLLLSRLRASKMASYLYDRGLEQYRVIAVGLGDSQPKVSVADPDGNVSNNTQANDSVVSTGSRVELRLMEN